MEKMEASVEEQSPLIPDSVPVETQSLAKDRKKKIIDLCNCVFFDQNLKFSQALTFSALGFEL